MPGRPQTLTSRGHARMTNMKRTLLHSLPAFHALMEWYPLRDTVQPFLGERLTTLFAHAISAETDCLICSTFFRRMLIQTGENPERLKLDERETAVVEFGRALAVSPFQVPDEVYQRLRGALRAGPDRGAHRLRRDHGGHQRVQQRARGGAGRVPPALSQGVREAAAASKPA